MSQKIVLHEGPVTATGNKPSVELKTYPAVVYCELDVSSAAAAGGDLLDVYLQTKIGDQWTDIIHFSQVPGTVATARYINKVVGDIDQAEIDLSAALVVKEKRHILGSEYRARWTIAGGTPNFTFKVTISTEARA